MPKVKDSLPEMANNENTELPLRTIINTMKDSMERSISELRAYQETLSTNLILMIGEVASDQETMQRTLEKSISELEQTQKTTEENLLTTISDASTAQVAVIDSLAETMFHNSDTHERLIKGVKESQGTLTDVLTKFMNCFSSTVFLPAELGKELSAIKDLLHTMSTEMTEFKTLHSTQESEIYKLAKRGVRVAETGSETLEAISKEWGLTNEGILELRLKLNMLSSIDAKAEYIQTLLDGEDADEEEAPELSGRSPFMVLERSNAGNFRVLEKHLREIAFKLNRPMAGTQSSVQVPPRRVRRVVMRGIFFMVYACGVLSIGLCLVLWVDRHFPRLLSENRK